MSVQCLSIFTFCVKDFSEGNWHYRRESWDDVPQLYRDLRRRVPPNELLVDVLTCTKVMADGQGEVNGRARAACGMSSCLRRRFDREGLCVLTSRRESGQRVPRVCPQCA
jgi:hypothetical protein